MCQAVHAQLRERFLVLWADLRDTQTFQLRAHELRFGAERIPPLVGNRTDLAAYGGQTQIGVILSEQEPILGPGRKQSVWLVRPLGDQVVDHHPDVRLAAFEDDRFLSAHVACSIYPCHQALRRRFFVA